MNHIPTAIYSTLAGGTALTSLLAGGTVSPSIYHMRAPESASYPFVLFSWQGGGDTNETPSRMQDELWFIRAYSKAGEADNGKEAGSIDAQIDALLHHKTLTVPGYTNWWTAREESYSTVEDTPSGAVFISGGVYRIRIDQ